MQIERERIFISCTAWFRTESDKHCRSNMSAARNCGNETGQRERARIVIWFLRGGASPLIPPSRPQKATVSKARESAAANHQRDPWEVFRDWDR